MEVVPSSSSPFGRVLKDHNLRERRPPTAAAAAAASKSHSNLQKTLQELVREHLRSSISACNENSNQSTDLPTKSEISSSVSCLVQKWRGIETHHPNQQQQQQIQNPELVTAIRINSLESDNGSISDWESDQAPINQRPASEKTANWRKKEKLRVVDIIRKLPLKVPLGKLECGELCSPRIRGRQAVADLLARLARGRYEELEALANRHVVSKFPKRGRIQSLIKFKLLRGESSSENSHRIHQTPKPQEFCKSIQQRLPSVNSLRRRFNKGPTELNELDNTTRRNSVEEKAKTFTLNQPSTAAEATKDNSQEEISLCIEDIIQQQQEDLELLDGVVKSESNNQQTEEVEEEEEEDFDTPRSSSSTEIVLQDTALQAEAEDPPQESGSDEEEAVFHYGSPGKTDTLSQNVWEEDYEEEIVENEEYYENDFCESSLDWIHEISRPHSYWESRRKAWYQEIFESSTNNDIRRLIERGSVSAVLASDFRDRMDQLMISNVQLQMHPTNTFLQRQIQNHEQEEAVSEEHVDGNGDIEEEEDGDYNNEQTPLIEEEDEDYNNEQIPLMELPWSSSYQDREIESATHRQESFVTNSYDHDSQVGSSSIKNGSTTIEMELISDIRAHMQQMYSEMSELRKVVNGCMEMQSKMQSSIREEVSAAMNHIKGKESKRKAPKKGSCCICHKKKADSLLYRCGHMCTCFECAHELQWSSGKCPICWAEIVDVVRVCTDYY